MLGQRHAEVEAGQLVYQDQQVVGVVGREYDSVVVRLVKGTPLDEHIGAVGPATKSDELPVGSVVSYVEDGCLHHAYKFAMSDTWLPAETDGKPASEEAQDWSEQESRPPVDMHGVYLLNVGLAWPVGVPTRGEASPQDVTEGAPRTEQAEALLPQLKPVRPVRGDGRTRKGEQSLRGSALDAHRKQRKAKKAASRKAKRKQRRR